MKSLRFGDDAIQWQVLLAIKKNRISFLFPKENTFYLIEIETPIFVSYHIKKVNHHNFFKLLDKED